MPAPPAPGRTLAVALAVVLAFAGSPAEAAASATFDVDEYRVEGNTLLPPADIEAAVYPFLGPGRTPEDVDRARTALDDLYAKRGYATVSAELPKQTVREGVIVFRIIERKVGRLRVVGSRYHSLDEIKAAAPSVAEGAVPNIDALQKQLIALNRQPDRTVTPELKPGRLPDTVDVDLKVEDSLPVHGSIELNNKQQVGTAPLRASASLTYGDLWQRGDAASVSFQLAPQNPAESQVLAASYLFRIPGSGLALLASYTRSSSNVTTAGTTSVLGSGDTAGLRIQIPLWFEPGFSQTLIAGGDYKSYRQNLTLAGATSQVPITYYPLSVTYDGSWTDFDAAEATTTPVVSTTDLTATLVFGTNAAGSGPAAFNNNRAYAPANFAYVRIGLDHLHTLPRGFQLNMHAQAQGTNDALAPQEQLSLGGADSVRGFFETEALADYGAILQAELRTPSAAELLGDPVSDLRAHAFFDTSTGGVRIPLPQQTSQYGLTSTGVGARVRLFGHLSGELQNAVSLSAGPATKAGADRVLFRLYGDF